MKISYNDTMETQNKPKRTKMTEEEKKAKWNEYKRKYDREHRDEINAINRRWFDKNKEQQAEYQATKIFCECCQKYIVFSYKARHEVTALHIKKLAAQLVATSPVSEAPSEELDSRSDNGQDPPKAELSDTM